jgi:hypothetical protein
VYKIPKTYTENKSITSVLSAGYDYSVYGASSPISGATDVIGLANKLADATTGYAPNTTIEASLVGDNTVAIRNFHNPSDIKNLKVVLSNDPSMNNLNPTTIPAFSKLVTLAVKAWIYTNMTIPLDSAALSGGMEIGRVKDIVDEFADSNELYQTYLEETWTKVAFMDDRKAYNQHLRLSIN